MGVKTPTITLVPTPGNVQGWIYQWVLASGDSGAPITNDFLHSPDRSFQVEGTFGAGGAVVCEGSNDDVNFHTLHDPFANLLTFTSAGLSEITEVCDMLRPRVTGGDGTTSLTVTVVLSRKFR